ncbi:MAG: HAD-IA family hydrolase [Candidatus Rokubacteria bacterium]|nr:HAD-IA family hydrolase [Candidatus Rokubacteria bacterium]
MRGIGAIIFDMDGVLVDSEPLNFEALRLVLARYGIAYSEADNAPFVGVTDREHFRALRARYGLEPLESELMRGYTELLVRLIQDGTRPMPGVPGVLQQLREAGYRLAVASSAAPQVIAATLEALRIAGLFEAVVSGLEVDRGKPAPDVFLETAQRLGLPPRACLVVEDSRNGMLAAKAAGMPCVAIPCPATRHQDFSEAHVRLAELAALPALMAEAGRARKGTLR